MDAKTFSETAKEVEKETVTQESSPEKEVTPKEQDEFAEDTEFQEVKKGIDDDIKNQKTIHPRFREVYKKYKDAQRQLDELANKEPEPYNPSDDELGELASKRGFKLDKIQQAQEKLDELGSMLDKVGNPQEREWWKNYASAIERKLSQKYDEPLNQFAEMAVSYRLKESESEARKLISSINKKHGLNIDYDKDVDSELAKMIKADKNLNRYNTDMLQLTQRYLAEHGIEFGKRISEKAQRELNKQKKQANIEGEGTTAAPKVDFSKMSFQDIAKHTEKELA